MYVCVYVCMLLISQQRFLLNVCISVCVCVCVCVCMYVFEHLYNAFKNLWILL